jgi:hypothetical protein
MEISGPHFFITEENQAIGSGAPPVYRPLTVLRQNATDLVPSQVLCLSQERKLSVQPHPPAPNLPLAPNSDDDGAAYGARINRLFRDALRDLQDLKQPSSREPPD